ncbi:hypothetical protein, partial [Escherichia coli]|uniref:hypothetical protein n=1 Tax=Escherichia coli TaxID=562 RepID=UPI001BAE9D31
YINILFTYTYLSNSKISKNAYFKFREHSQNSTIDESGISSFLERKINSHTEWILQAHYYPSLQIRY